MPGPSLPADSWEEYVAVLDSSPAPVWPITRAAPYHPAALLFPCEACAVYFGLDQEPAPASPEPIAKAASNQSAETLVPAGLCAAYPQFVGFNEPAPQRRVAKAPAYDELEMPRLRPVSSVSRWARRGGVDVRILPPMREAWWRDFAPEAEGEGVAQEMSVRVGRV